MRYLYYRSHPGGLGNKKMSLDVGVGLAWLGGRTLVVYDGDRIWPGENPHVNEDGARRRSALSDLYEIPVPHLPAHEFRRLTPGRSTQRATWGHLHEAVCVQDPEAWRDHEQFSAFRNGRKRVFHADEAGGCADVLVFDDLSVTNYSYFFYLEDALRERFRQVMEGVRPRTPYVRLARRIAEDLGRFHAVSIRLGEFRRWSFTKAMVRIPQTELVRNLSAVLPTSEPLAIVTDESNNREWFEPFFAAYPRAFFLDRHIVTDRTLSGLLRDLPTNDHIALALVLQLVAAQAEEFVGTLCSTFTAMIQRLRGHADPGARFLYTCNPFTSRNPFRKSLVFRDCEFHETRDGPFSWNRIHYPVAPGTVSWFREWPEAFRATLR